MDMDLARASIARTPKEGGHRPENADGTLSVAAAACAARVRVDGKFFRAGSAKWHVKGYTYGPFAPGDVGDCLPPLAQVTRDLAHLHELGANCIRVYHPPPLWLLDEAFVAGLRVFVDVPWQKHRCFVEDWSARQEALRRVSQTARRLAGHPGLFAISVANEIPNDILRYHGPRNVGRVVGELVDAVKQAAPDCLTTYANFPSTEFFRPPGVDFACFNVYLNDPDQLGPYLDRLQHVADGLPLVLGEFGLDALRNGPAAQAEALRRHIDRVFRHGLAGSFVFSYTDDWYTGGHSIHDWAFGVTTRDRAEKPAAAAVRDAWGRARHVEEPNGRPLPSVSVVVCSYNGAATLEECLRSLQSLNYPDYEVILVDDGSTDATESTAGRFPSVRYIHQANRGLSVARNVGAHAARGQIVAYTDSDCVADEDWLLHLVRSMRDQRVDAVGGPNVPPPRDGWVAKCVAASPGGPSHVMLDDRCAEHVPGCNMAFDRATLLALGGFDPQFRVAGDDVDVCWRLLDRGLRIGYAPAALVWHHRRSSIGGYLRQQRGYGRSEALLRFKHPERFNAAGNARWNGVIYGEGAVGLPLAEPRIKFGRFGTGLFQIVYRTNQYTHWAWYTLLEWYALAVGLLALSIPCRSAGLVGLAMFALSLVAAARSALAAPLPKRAPFWCRPLVMGLHLLQPAVRAFYRYRVRLSGRLVPTISATDGGPAAALKRIAAGCRDLYWRGTGHRGRLELLECLEAAARRAHWAGIFGADWDPWDAVLFAGAWFDVRLRTASEELGGGRRFTRARFQIAPTPAARASAGIVCGWCVVAALLGHPWLTTAGAIAGIALAASMVWSAARALRSTAALVWNAGLRAGLDPVPVNAPPPLPIGGAATDVPATDDVGAAPAGAYAG